MVGRPPHAGVILRAAREKKGLSQEDLAKVGDTSRQQVQRLEAGTRKMTKKWAKLLGPAVDLSPVDLVFDEFANAVPSREGLIPFMGEVAAGRWIEIETQDDGPEHWLPFTPEPDMTMEGVYALRVRGNSMDKIAPDGTIVICRDVAASGIDIEPDDFVIIERRREQDGLREVTMKRVRRTKRGVELVPESHDSKWKPVVYSTKKRSDDLDLVVKAIVEYIVTPTRRRGGYRLSRR